MLILASLTAGSFMAALVLWYMGVGTATSAGATARLARLGGNQPMAAAGGPEFSLRKKYNTRFGGINLVSSDVVARWIVQLERAGLTLNVREYVMLRIGVAAVAGLLAFMLAPLQILGLVALPIGFVLPALWVNRRVGARTRKIESQMVELLQMLASGLRAGFGLLQAIEAAAEQLPAPMSIEIRRMLRDTAMGASVDQAMTAMNERIGSSDFDIVVTAILIQRSVGGNLAEILDSVAHTMRERERIKGEIRALTSQQRMTGYVIAGIPIGLLGIFNVINPEFAGLLFTDPLGRAMLVGAFIWEAIGFMIIRKIVDIEV